MQTRKHRYNLRTAVAAFATFGAAGVAFAGLYPPAAPPDSAFVRVFNATAGGKLQAQIGDKSLSAAAAEASDYAFLAPGQYPARAGGAATTVSLEGKHCYTAAAKADGLHLIDQDCFSSQLKSLVSVYNLIDGATLTVKAGDNGPAVVAGIASNSAGHREVNPVKAALAVFNGTTKLGDAKPVTLERGKVYSLFVTGSASSPVLTWVIN